MGEPLATTIEKIKEIVESTGAVLVSTEYVNNHSYLEFKCSKCGSPGKFTWKKYSQGQNKNFLCCSCEKEKIKIDLRKQKQDTSIEFIRAEFEKKGAHLISTEYINIHSPLEFNCANCGKPWKTNWSLYKQGKNSNLYCYSCNQERMGKKRWEYAELKEFFKENGSELYSNEYCNIEQKLEFKCKYCGDVAVYSLEQMMQRKGDRRFFCKSCILGNRLKPNGTYGGNKRHLYDLQWFKYIYKFFNIPKELQKIYSAHHINRFDSFPDFRTSFCNGYPIKVDYHDLGAKDPETGLGNPFHVVDGYLCVTDYPDYVKLPYHTYMEFKFLDLNSKMVTEIIAPKDDMDKNYLRERYLYFQEKGLFYLPLFFDELFVESRLNVVCSIVRRYLYKWFPDIYRYTGQEYMIIESDLYCEFISVDLAKEFLRDNNLNGFIKASFYVGVFSKDLLVGVILGENFKDSIKILGWTERLNTIVDKGFIFGVEFIKNIFKPVIITYKVDFRFALYDYGDLLCVNQTEPQKFYVDKKTNRYFKSMKRAEKFFEKKIYDCVMVEKLKENPSDFIVLYDLGELEYVWKKTEDNHW